MDRRDPAVRRLLEDDFPSARYFALTELCGLPVESGEAKRAQRAIVHGPQVRVLLAGQLPDGGFGRRPYQKWHGAHWRLVSLVELGVPEGFPPAIAAAENVLTWIESEDHYPVPYNVAGRWRCHASIPGNALAVCSRLGLAGNVRVQELVNVLLETQWPDGGWNCDPNPSAHHSSFHESLAAMWGLTEYYNATASRKAHSAANKTAELFLHHNLFLSDRTGRVIDRRWCVPHYPPYWHYDIFQSLLVLSRLGMLSDPRADAALSMVMQKRRPDGCWSAGQRYWRLAGEKSNKPLEVLDWEKAEPNKMVTLNALRVLKSAGRL